MSSDASSAVVSQAGYTLLPGAFAADEVAALRAAADRALRRTLDAARTVDPDRTTTVWADGHRLQQVEGTTIHWEPDAPEVARSLSPVTHLDPRLDALWTDHRVTGPARDVLGVDEVSPLRSALNLKKAGVGSEYRWHQDAFDIPVVNVVIFLDEARADNGPLGLLPGSHLAGRAPIDPADPVGQHPSPSLVDSDGEQVITGVAGTVLAFTALLMHRSDANRSPYDRRALRLCLRSGSGGGRGRRP